MTNWKWLLKTVRQWGLPTLIIISLVRLIASQWGVVLAYQCLATTNCWASSLNASANYVPTGGDSEVNAPPSIRRYILCASASCTNAQQQFEQQFTPIRFRNSTEVQEMYQQGRFLPHRRIVLVESLPLANTQKIQVDYTFDDAARLVSHLEAILTAYTDGSELAFFLEENAVLDTNFWSQWEQVAAVAPSDWRALQWTTNNVPTLQQGVRLHKNMDQWISWLPDHVGTHAYTLRREAMQAILARTYKTNANKTVWDVKLQYPMLLPHEVIFYLASPAYTATFPWSQTLETTRVLQDGKLLPLPPSNAFHFPTRHETVLMLMNVRLSSKETLTHELVRLRTDVEILCDHYHANTKCHWIVNVVLTGNSLLPLFSTWTTDFSPHVEFEVSISDQPFNKFSFLLDHIPAMSNYDLVVFKDNDQRITGTPWNTMLNLKEKAVVAGSIRQVVAESFRGTQTYKRTWFNSAENWKHETPKWSYDLFVQVQELEINYLEMHLVIMDGNFAAWFWRSVLIPEFVNQTSVWGVDHVWCPAAATYANETQSTKHGCIQVPVISLHENTGQMKKLRGAFMKIGNAALDILYANLPYPRWTKTTLGKMLHNKQHRDIEKGCQILLNTSDVDIHQCFKVAMSMV